ncbi:hypothetical protein PLICRDRAFT_103115 [Plicaturopsis crispa FD-325 SS-3]|nr:hypothetical protein PLICRDRAFT_103115 [Plicaturopsis crispa FD-325 SS-3]
MLYANTCVCSDSRPITDDRGKVIGALCCPPEDADWHDGAAAAFDDARQRMRFPKKDSNHRRGTFCAQAVGSSFGGGQKMPGNLVNTAVNTAILASLLSNIYIIRIAGFASAAFATWAPNLYTYYVEHLRPLHTTYPRLKRNFINSVFAAATFNFGPVTCTYPHRDPGNLPFGWCAITALGKFDPTRGGHLVLWDMHLIIEFPPGTTILIPSATIRHSNVAIQKGETRFSFTQYTAGGLFRWVDQGFQPSSSFLAALSSEEVKEEKVRAKVQERWNMGVNLFSDLTSLQQPPNFDAV